MEVNKRKLSFFAVISLIFIIFIIFIIFLFFGGDIKRAEIVRNKEKEIPLEEKTNFIPISQIITTPTFIPTTVPTNTPIDYDKKYGPCRRVPILMYHHILETNKAKEIGAENLNVPPEIFREQLDYLLRKGYTVIGLDEMLKMIRDNNLPKKPIVLTFDDGYADFYSNVFPILKEKNLKATVFIITQFVGGERYVNWNQVKEVADSGLVLVGDHTLNHPYLSRLSEEETKNQIVSAKNILEQNIGKSVQFFAYPYGNVSFLAKAVLQQNGFLGAVVTTSANPQCLGLPYQLSRLRVGATFLSKYGL